MAEGSNVVYGNIKNDPSINLPAGESLKFKPCLVTHKFESNFVLLREWQSFDGILLSIHFANIDLHSVDGSAVLVAPGIALCAKHVIGEKIDKIISGQLSPAAMALSRDGVQLWRISKICLVDNTDLAIIGLTYSSSLPPENLFNQATISTRTPKIGEKLLIAGFRASDYHFDIQEQTDGNKKYEFSGNVFCGNGIVTNTFLTGRDSSMLPWPSLEVNCPSLGGMSGGPVFDSSGLLIGILSTSINGDGPSYVSLLWPALTVEFEGGWPTSLFKDKTTLLNLAPSVCKIDKPNALSRDETGKTKYTIWQ